MATPQNISQILAALGQRPPSQQQGYGTPQAQQPFAPPGQMPPAMPQYQMPANPMPGQAMPLPNLGYGGTPAAPYAAPRPTGSGTLNLFDPKPVNSGMMNMNNNGPPNNYGGGYASSMRPDPYSSRSRSRSPGRSSSNRAPYRDDRRMDSFMPSTDSQPSRYGGPSGSDDRSTETVMIDASVVGLIIGRQGESMRQIESRTQTKIQFDKAHESSGSMRKCTITGTKPARDYAVQEINRIIDDHERTTKGTPASRNSGPASSVASRAPGGSGDTTIMVPSRSVGLVIGKGGETIKDIQDRTQCHVNITTQDQDVNGLRPVHLLGTKQQTSYAKDVIFEVVGTDSRNRPMPGGPRFDDVNNMALGSRAGDDREVPSNMQVPSEAVGMIIGKGNVNMVAKANFSGGETVREMQSVTGCRINVHQPSGNDIERQIELVGTMAAIDHAKSLINEKVQAVHERNGTLSNRNELPYGNATAPAPPAATAGTVDEPPGGHEAYAAYGGYQNYVALWYASQQAKQPGTGADSGAAQYP